jgi:hypothetical protein
MRMAATIMMIYVAVFLAGVYGWVHNIVLIAHSDFGHLTGMFVLRCIGVFVAPLGAVLGFC